MFPLYMAKIDLIFKLLPKFHIELENIHIVLWNEKITPYFADVNLFILSKMLPAPNDNFNALIS